MTSSTIFPFHFFSSGKTFYLLFQKGSKERRRNFSRPFAPQLGTEKAASQ
jgi:hypothetical protein